MYLLRFFVFSVLDTFNCPLTESQTLALFSKILMTLKEPMPKQQVTPRLASLNTLVDSKNNMKKGNCDWKKYYIPMLGI